MECRNTGSGGALRETKDATSNIGIVDAKNLRAESNSQRMNVNQVGKSSASGKGNGVDLGADHCRSWNEEMDSPIGPGSSWVCSQRSCISRTSEAPVPSFLPAGWELVCYPGDPTVRVQYTSDWITNDDPPGRDCLPEFVGGYAGFGVPGLDPSTTSDGNGETYCYPQMIDESAIELLLLEESMADGDSVINEAYHRDGTNENGSRDCN